MTDPDNYQTAELEFRDPELPVKLRGKACLFDWRAVDDLLAADEWPAWRVAQIRRMRKERLQQGRH